MTELWFEEVAIEKLSSQLLGIFAKLPNDPPDYPSSYESSCNPTHALEKIDLLIVRAVTLYVQ